MIYCEHSERVAHKNPVILPELILSMRVSSGVIIRLAPVVQRLDNAIHRINRYPVDKYWQNKPRYPLDSDLSGG